MKESVAIAKDAAAKKESSPTRSDNSIQRLRNEPERQLGSLRDVIGNIRRNGGIPSVESIATELSVMPYSDSASALLALQQTHGNQYVQRVVTGIQAKLKIGQPNDIYEQEADKVADAIMRMPEPEVQRQVEEEKEKKEEELIQTKPISEQITPLVQRQVEEEEEEEILQTRVNPGQTSEVTSDLESRIQSLKGSGQPLPEANRNLMERRFGVDFNNVRIHTDSNAAQMSKELNAEAFTYGRGIYFGADKYGPGTYAGKKLLAHELTHVVQQRKLHNLQMSSETSKSAWVEQGPRNTEQTFMSGQQLPPIKQIISSDVVARSWQPGRREEGEPAGVPGGLTGYVRRIQRLLSSGSDRALNLTRALEPGLSPMRQRTRLVAPGQQNAEDAQDLQQFFVAYGGVSAFVEQLFSCLEVMARVSGRGARFRGDTEEERRRGARAWLVDIAQAIARTYPAIAATVEDPARRLFDIERAEREQTRERAEETRGERVAVNQLISGTSIQSQWRTYWQGQYLSPSNNQGKLAKWLLDRWNEAEINRKLITARWRPNRSLTGSEDYRNSFAVINVVASRLGSTVDGGVAGNSYFDSIYEDYHDQLHQLGCDLTNYLLPDSSAHLGTGAFDRAAFVGRMDAWEGLRSNDLTTSMLPHHNRIRAMFRHFNDYRGRRIPGLEFALHMLPGSHRYPSGIYCDTNACIFPGEAVPR